MTMGNFMNQIKQRDNALLLVAALAVLLVILLLSGCMVGQDYIPVSKEMPSAWNQPLPSAMKSEPNLPVRWWEIFGDAELNHLIELAAANNQDVKAAFSRLEASRALRDYTTGQYYPTVDAAGSYSRYQASKDGAVKLHDEPDPVNLHSGGFDFLWEIDLFGKIRRSVESSEASYQASIEDYRDVMVMLLAEVCRNYVDLRTTQMRIAYAEDNIKIQRDTLGLTKNRYESEIAGELDVRQAELNLANTQAEIPSLRIAETAARNRLAVLVGQMPGAMEKQLSQSQPLPSIKEKIAVGLPADLLRQRPDIRRAERQLAAQTAQIGVATADLYPSLQLMGTFEIQSRQLTGLGNIHNKAYSFGPGVQWRLFDANRIKNTIKIEEATTRELLARWENAVLLAAEDLENSIVSYAQQTERKNSLDNSVKASLRSLELVESQYKSGLTDFQNVLDTQRTLFGQQDKLATSQGEVLKSLVQIYKGFGGGWQIDAVARSSEKKSDKQ
ncbi:MAG: efflux transporter outer membrane subunit [Planctomycetes bacterium]|nr:efflux transporter outer membrane subunit [Planctomycetota bacterium]